MVELENYTLREAYLVGMLSGMLVFCICGIIITAINYVDEKVRKMYRDRMIHKYGNKQ